MPTTTLLFLALAPFTIDASAWNTNSALIFAAVGLAFPALATLMTFWANRMIGPSITGAFSNMTPVFAMAFAGLLLGETLSGLQLLAVLAVVGGAALLYLGRGVAVPVGLTWAILLPLAVAAIRALAQALVKIGLVDWPSPYAATTITYVFSSLVILSVGLARDELPSLSVTRERAWFALVGVLNGLSVLFVYLAIARGPVTLVSALVACFPLMIVVLNRVVRGDRTLTAAMAAGIALTVAGVVMLVMA